MADTVATLSSMLQLKEAKVDGKSWYHDIREYLREGVYPPGATENDKRTLRRLVVGFILSGVILYERSADLMLLRCVDDQQAQEVMEEVHEGTFGTLTNGHALAHKILRVGYYWTKMESDCCQHMKRCMKCQVYADNIHVAPSTLYNLTSPWPFFMYGSDMIDPIEPKASNEHRFILVAIDYFMKWIEAASYASTTKSVVVKFIKRDIICRYGLLAHIITDNGTNLNNKMMIELCEQFKIKHHNSTPYHPKMNRAVEAANKNIKKIVSKMVVTYKDSHDMLPYTLHGYQTSMRTSTGATLTLWGKLVENAPTYLVFDI
ncbi:Gypsy retrotransposon integrase-like protein 1, partial [Mucuna pruriens]